MKTITIRIDIYFRGRKDEQLEEYLSSGWKIVDKTMVGERYIYFVIAENN
jgi:hypothetical protein